MTEPEIERQERLQVTAADGTTHRFYTQDEMQAAIAAAMMWAVRACIGQADIFASPEYAGTNLANSFSERFACGECADAIEKIIPTDAMAALEAMLAEAEKRGRDEAFKQAAKCCDDEADLCDDAVKWGGAAAYIKRCKAASYAMRSRAAAIRAMKGGE